MLIKGGLAINKINNSNPNILQICMLGNFELTYQGKSIKDSYNRSHKLWNLLGYLITHHNRSIPQSEFIEMIWENSSGENPLSSLKTTFSRLRTFLEPVTPDGINYILSSRGSYHWNESVDYCLDIELFEAYCREGSEKSVSISKRITSYQKALDLYKGDFLARFKDDLWVVPLTAYYHSIYLDAVKDLYQLLKLEHRTEEMVDCCTKALTIDAYDEKLHCNLIEVLILQGNFSSGLLHYQKATEILYRNLSVKPSSELNQLYHSLMRYQSELEMDASVIINRLTEQGNQNGAFICDYGVFEEIYRLQARQALRANSSTCICVLITIIENNKIPSLEILDSAMKKLLESIIVCLRSGDVVSKYSGAQYLLLLPCFNTNNAIKIVKRIQKEYYQRNKKSTLYLKYSFAPIKK